MSENGIQHTTSDGYSSQDLIENKQSQSQPEIQKWNNAKNSNSSNIWKCNNKKIDIKIKLENGTLYKKVNYIRWQIACQTCVKQQSMK